MRLAILLLVLLTAARAGPGRHIRYAESTSRLVYAFVFGSRDTCRVIRRPEVPRIPLRTFLRRPPGASHRGAPGETLLREFGFGRQGRPVHIVPTNDGGHLLAFANRAPDGSPPGQDRIWLLEEKPYASKLDYSGLPRETQPAWPELKRALAPPKKKEREATPLSYAFLARELVKGRVIVGRQSEDGRGVATDMVCFVVEPPQTDARLPAPAELSSLLKEEEPLLRASGAWALGLLGKRESVAELKAALARTEPPPARARIAEALVRCGDSAGRRTLRALVEPDAARSGRRSAALALARLPPDRSDGDVLAKAIADADAETAELAGIALARVGGAGRNALVRAARSSQAPVRAAAARVLGRVDDAAAEQRLLRLVGDSDATVQTAAAVALTNPPRAILPQNHGEFARALDAARRKRNRRAAYRLSLLAAHAGIHHEKVLEALVAMTVFHDRAVETLQKLTREPFVTSDDWKLWWAARKKK